MQKFITGFVVTAMLILAVASFATATSPLTRDRKKEITFTQDVLVKDQIIKKGTYRIEFDAETSEVSILKNGDVMVSVKADVQVEEMESRYNSATYADTDKGKELRSLRFSGDRRVIVISNAQAVSAGN